MNKKLEKIVTDAWNKWHEDFDPDNIPAVNPSMEKGALAVYEYVYPILMRVRPIISAHAGATHMLEGFHPKRNKWDDFVDEINELLADE